MEASGCEKLLVGFEHAERLVELPPHHRDPFDRMLIAQALEERLTVVTGDRTCEPYDVDTLWARAEPLRVGRGLCPHPGG